MKREKSLAILLKEQDRDTRHACAEAFLDCIDKEAAYEVIMNTKAV